MTPLRPYLLGALREWIMDNGLTPHILVDAAVDGVDAPAQFVKDGKMALNIGPAAVRDFTMDDKRLLFNARFGGVSRSLEIPYAALLAIYARENGRGMAFPQDEPLEEALADAPVDASAGASAKAPHPAPPVAGKPKLKIVK